MYNVITKNVTLLFSFCKIPNDISYHTSMARIVVSSNEKLLELRNISSIKRENISKNRKMSQTRGYWL